LTEDKAMTRWNRAILVVWLIGARVWRRLAANRGVTANALNFIRAMSSSRIRYQAKVAYLGVRRSAQGETMDLPEFYRRQVQDTLGPLWEVLPVGALKRHNLSANQPPKDSPTQNFGVISLT
jgi:hypothetical protein